MKKCLIAILIAALVASCNFQTTPSDKPASQSLLETQASVWTQLGGALNINADRVASSSSLDADALGHIAVSWKECTDTNCDDSYIQVKSWNGNSWDSLDTLGSRYVFTPSLSLDGSGNPVVSWIDTNRFRLEWSIGLARWNGTSWVDATGGDANSIYIHTQSYQVETPSLAVDALGQPALAWIECIDANCSVQHLHVKRWNSSGLALTGNTLNINSNQRAQNPSLSLDASGNPVVSWQEHDGSSWNIYVKRWNGSSWIQVGDALDFNPNRSAESPSLALDSTGNPTVSWTERNNTSTNIYVKKWNGTSWVQIGGTLGRGDKSSLVLDSANNPVVAYDSYVKRWNGTSWIRVGSTQDLPDKPSLALDGSDNPVINLERNSPSNVYVSRWITNGWQPLGSLDNTPTNSVGKSAIARTSNNLPIVAWEENISPTASANIYVKQWTGSSWQALGSALDVILENNARNPSTSVRSDNLPVVAWTENPSGGTYTTYLKQWTGSAWVQVGPAITTLDQSYPSLALDNNNVPYLAWIEYTYNNGNQYRVKFAKLVNNAWRSINGVTGPDTMNSNLAYAKSPSLALDANGNPSVAWSSSNISSIYVITWTGSTWVRRSIGAVATDVSLALNSTTGLPVVAYTALVGSDYSVYVKRWNAATNAWNSYGSTVDASGTNGFYPKLKLNSNNVPYVVYEEKLGSSRNVYVKRWIGGSWQTVGVGLDNDLNATTVDSYPSMVLKTNNAPIVAWTDFSDSSNFSNLYVKQY